MPYIPDSIFKSGIWETLSGVETRVYVILCQHYNRAEKKAYPSVIRIAKMCGSSKSRVIKTVHSLCEKGLVIKKKKANPYGQDFNYYLLPDFLLYEYELLSKDPKKNIDTIMEITNILMKELGGVKTTPAGVRKTPMGVKSDEMEVSNCHPNYIINHINIINSFNKKDKKNPSIPFEEKSRWEERPPEITTDINNLLEKLRK